MCVGGSSNISVSFV